MKAKYTMLMILAAAIAPAASAQTHPAKHHEDGTVHVVNSDTVNGHDVYEKFAEISPEAFNVPDAPRFAFVGKDKKFYLGIGGTLKTTVSYDFGSTMNNPNSFITEAIPMNPAPGNNGLLQFSAQQSSIYLNFVALPDNPNQVGVYLQGNFLGNNYSFQLQYAYVTYRGFTVGYNYSLFTDLAAAPPTIDYEGPNALTLYDNLVVDYTHSFGKHWGVGIGVEMPQASYTASASTSVVNQRIPDIPAYVQYSFGNGGSWLRLSGLLRNITYRDNVASKNRTATGWGVKLDGSATVNPMLTFYYQGVYGHGISNYIQDLTDGGMDLMPSATTDGKLDAVKAWGAYGGVQVNFSPKVYSTATYSHVRCYADKYQGGTTAWGNQYKYAQYLVANTFYNVNKVLSLGVEYIWGRRVNNDGTSHHDNRVQAMVQVSF